MLSRLILLAVQLAVAWFAAESVVNAMPPFGRLNIFVYAAVVAVLVWVVGLVLSQVLKETAVPSSATLVTCLIVALIGAALVFFRPYLPAEVRSVMRSVPDEIYPIIGAVLGYHMKR